jgi:PhzF family phenazine biosynthesis protein
MSAQIVPFKQVDVFTAVPYRGNPVAVILDGASLDGAQMQALAAWTNLSETVFVLPPTQSGTDYRLRIFTPRSELPFAGHPSVGAAHAVLESGWARQHDHQLIMECAAGVLPIHIEGDGAARRLYVRAPAARIDDPDMTLSVGLAKALGATINLEPSPRVVNVGPNWIVVDLENEARVRALRPDMARLSEVLRDFSATGVAVYGRTGRTDVAMAVRCFCPADGIPEDPVTGSGNAAIAAYMRAYDLVTPPVTYVASQGREVGRDGYLHMRLDEQGHIDIGGQAVTCIDGTIRL